MSHSALSSDHHDHHPKGIKRWLFTTNHKDIGTLYLWFSGIMFLVAGAMAMMIRLELYSPGKMLVSPEIFNQLTTMHGIVMLFGVVMPAATGFANWLIPLMIGAPDMALPRLNNWSFWLLPFAFGLAFLAIIFDQPGPDFGWTFYAPLSTTYAGPSTDFFIFTVHMLGISSILASLNVVVTIFNMRAPGMKLMNMPVFVWSWLTTAFLLLAIMPVLAGCVTMMLMDRHFGTSFFNAAGGGDPLLFQHVFWFFGHPEVYVLVLPAFGIISEIIPVFSRKNLFGYAAMVYATIIIAVIGFLVWMHHMFTTGAPLGAQLFFMYMTMLVAVPTGVKIFNWIATMYKGEITFEAPMLFALAFLVVFTLGGFSGIMCSVAPADYQYRGSYFIVAHFHYVLMPVIFALMGGVYLWLPKWTGRMYSEKLARWHFWLTLISFNACFFPMHFVGLAGMPRRVPDYALQFTTFNRVETIAALIMGLAQLIFFFNVLRTVRGKGAKATARVWDGAKGLIFNLPSPPPYHSFATPPEIKGKDYE